MQKSIIDANAKVEQVRNFLHNYVQNNGCLNMSMHELRYQFAQIYPPSAPEFLYHFSTLAQTAIAEDVRRGRHAYPIGGSISSDFDPMEGDPFILPGKAIFHDSKEVFRRALGKEWNNSRSDFRNGTRTAEHVPQNETDTPESKPTLLSIHPEPHRLERIFDERVPPVSTLRPHPRFTPPSNESFVWHVESLSNAARANRLSGTPPGSPTANSRTQTKRNCSDSPSFVNTQESYAQKNPRQESTNAPLFSSPRRDSQSGKVSAFPDCIGLSKSEYEKLRQKGYKNHSSLFHTDQRAKAISISSNDENSSSDESNDTRNKPSQENNHQISFVAKVKLHYDLKICQRKTMRGFLELHVKYKEESSNILQTSNKPSTHSTRVARNPQIFRQNFLEISWSTTSSTSISSTPTVWRASIVRKYTILTKNLDHLQASDQYWSIILVIGRRSSKLLDKHIPLLIGLQPIISTTISKICSPSRKACRKRQSGTPFAIMTLKCDFNSRLALGLLSETLTIEKLITSRMKYYTVLVQEYLTVYQVLQSRRQLEQQTNF